MKFTRLFASFGAGLKPSQIWMYVAAGLTIVSGTISLLSKSESSAHSLGSFYFLAFGLFVWWSVVANRAWLLTQDIQRLRMPVAATSVFVGLGVHFICTVLAPALLCAICGAAGASAMLAFATCMALLTLIAPLLPNSLGTASGAFGLLPVLCWLLADKGVLPGVRDAGFPLYAWSAATVMAVVLVVRYRALLAQTADDASDGFVLGRYRRQLIAGGFNADSALQDQPTLAAEKQVRLERAGPGNPAQVVRAWLGAPFAPMSLPTQVRHYLLPLTLSAAAALVFVAVGMVNTMALVIIIFGQNIYFAQRNLFLPRLQRVFAGNGGDVEFLGTLPGMGSGSTARHAALAAVFTPFLTACAMQFVFVVALARAMSGVIGHQLQHGQSFDLASIFVALICADLGLAVLLLNAMVGRTVSRWAEVPLLLLAMFVALTLTHVPFASTVLNALEAALVSAFAVPLAWAGISAWRAYRRRPHPFLLDS